MAIGIAGALTLGIDQGMAVTKGIIWVTEEIVLSMENLCHRRGITTVTIADPCTTIADSSAMSAGHTITVTVSSSLILFFCLLGISERRPPAYSEVEPNYDAHGGYDDRRVPPGSVGYDDRRPPVSDRRSVPETEPPAMGGPPRPLMTNYDRAANTDMYSRRDQGPPKPL